MKWNYYRRVIAGTFCALCVIGGMPSVRAEAGKADLVYYSLDSIEYTNNGGKTMLSMNKRAELEDTLDTRTLDEGYYTSFLYAKEQASFTEGQVLALSISTKKELNMNVNLLDKKGNVFLCKDGEGVYIKESYSDYYQLVSVENGSFHVPKDFNGTVYIPLNTVALEKETEKLNQLAFVVTQKEGEVTAFTLRSLSIHPKDGEIGRMAENHYQLTGEAEVTIPAVGEYEYAFSLSGNTEEEEVCSVSLAEEVMGVSISKEGSLLVTEEAMEQTVPLIFTNTAYDQIRYDVELVHSWYVKQQDADAINFIIPSKEEVESYTDYIEKGKMADAIDFVARMLLIAGTVSYLIFYSKKIRQN